MKTSTKSTFVIIGTLIIGIILGILGGGILHQKRFEQVERMRRMAPEKRFEKTINEIIKPDEKQRNRIRELLKKQADKIAQLDEEYQSKILSIFDSTRQQINSSLNEEQIIRLEEQLINGHKQFIERHLERLDKILDLSNEQREKIEGILNNFQPPFSKNHRSHLGKPNKRRQKIFNNFEEMDKKIESVLTPEQQKKYSKFKLNRIKNRRTPPSGEFPAPPPKNRF